jgi:hypothetical protein
MTLTALFRIGPFSPLLPLCLKSLEAAVDDFTLVRCPDLLGLGWQAGEIPPLSKPFSVHTVEGSTMTEFEDNAFNVLYEKMARQPLDAFIVADTDMVFDGAERLKGLLEESDAEVLCPFMMHYHRRCGFLYWSLCNFKPLVVRTTLRVSLNRQVPVHALLMAEGHNLESPQAPFRKLVTQEVIVHHFSGVMPPDYVRARLRRYMTLEGKSPAEIEAAIADHSYFRFGERTPGVFSLEELRHFLERAGEINQQCDALLTSYPPKEGAR